VRVISTDTSAARTYHNIQIRNHNHNIYITHMTESINIRRLFFCG
jgi:hypothetical protein